MRRDDDQSFGDLPDLTEQQMKFVEAILAGKRASDAYRAAYDCSKMGANSIWVDASRLRHHPNVALWLSAARKASLGSGSVTLADHVNELERLREIALDTGNLGAAVQAEQLRGKAMGHYTEKLDVTVTDIADELRKLAKVSPELAKAYADEKGVTWQ